MKLFSIHCGYYPNEGIYEAHHNFFIVGVSYCDAQSKIKLNENFKSSKMHIDSIQELNIIDNHLINLEESEIKDDTGVYRHRELGKN